MRTYGGKSAPNLSVFDHRRRRQALHSQLENLADLCLCLN